MAVHVKVRYLNSWWRRQVARYHGRSDGRRNYPPSGAAVPVGYERTLLAFANSALAGWWYKRVEEREALEAKQEILLRRWKIAEADYDRAKKTYEHHGRAPVVPLPPWVYRLLMFLLLLAELPFNVAVFRTTGEADVVAYLMAFGVSLAVIFGAHLLGHHQRQSRQALPARSMATAVGIVVFVVILVALNHIRVTYLAELDSRDRFIADPQALEAAYFAINLLFFLVGALAAYFSHDEDDQIETDLARTEELDRERHSHHEAYVKAHSDHEAVHGELVAAHHDWAANVAEVVHHYRHANALHRETPPPAYFAEDPALQPLPWAGEAKYSDMGAPVPSYLGEDPEVASSMVGHRTATYVAVAVSGTRSTLEDQS